MRLFSKPYRVIIAIAVVAVGVAFLYFEPFTQSLFGLNPTPTVIPDYSTWRSYTNQKYGISLKYPVAFQLVPGKPGPLAEWQLSGLTSGINIVSIDIPRSTQVRTNFLGASLYIGLSTDATTIKECLNTPVSFQNTYTQRVIGGIVFRKFTRSEAAAGNLYEFTSYRAVQNGPSRLAEAGGCEVFEYSISKTNIQNFPVEANRKEFDRTAVINSLESVLDTVRFTK